MRALEISGLVPIALGIWIIIRPRSYAHEERVFKFGDLEAKMLEQHLVPGWAGGAGLGAALVLFLVGSRKT